MPGYLLLIILFWITLIGVATFFVVRELRAKRRGPGDLDRLQHEAHRRAGMGQDGHGPNGASQTWLG